MHRIAVPVLLLCVCLLGTAWADEEGEAQGLTIGDLAPDIDIAHWIKGVPMSARGSFTPVTKFGDGKVYVLEFWATWCGPCVRGMPHLSELQEKFPDVTIIGVSDETLPKVVDFLFKEYEPEGVLQNERMRYVVAADPDKSVKTDFFEAAGQRGIPCAFIIGPEGHVEWIGHPMRMDEPLAKVVGGTWDRAAFKAEYEAQKRLMVAARAGDWDTFVETLDELLATKPDDPQLLLTKFSTLLTAAARPDDAYAMADELLEAIWDDGEMLNEIAWTVVDDTAVVRKDLDFALKAALRADELTESKDAAVLDTLARVHYERGDLATALTIQRRAVEHAQPGRMAESIQKVLDKYEAEAAEKEASEPPADEEEAPEPPAAED